MDYIQKKKRKEEQIMRYCTPQPTELESTALYITQSEPYHKSMTRPHQNHRKKNKPPQNLTLKKHLKPYL